MADQQQLLLLKQGAKPWNTWRKERPEIGGCPYLEPKRGLAKKRQLLLFVLREKSSKNDFLRGICCLKLLFSVQTENFTEERYRLIQ